MEMASEQFMAATRGRAVWSESAFERVFAEFYGRIVGALHRMLGDRAQAEELASEAFLRLYQQPQEQEGYENIGGWLYRTAMRLGIDSLRAAGRRAQREHEAGTQFATTTDTPLDEALRAERARQVRCTLARLKPVQAQILILRSSGLSYKELADALEVKPTSVGQLLARAEEAFQRAWPKANPRQ